MTTESPEKLSGARQRSEDEEQRHIETLWRLACEREARRRTRTREALGVEGIEVDEAA